MAVPIWVARANRYLVNPIVKRFAGRVPPFALLEHRGRQSGKRYRIPIIVFRTGDTFTIALTYGAKTDWVKNVRAAGCCTIKYRRRRYLLVRPRLGEDPTVSWAPLPVRLIEGRVGATEYLRLDVVP